MESYKINENITLHYIPMTKLKTTRMGIYIGRPLDENEASENAVLPYVLLGGSKQARSSAELAKALQELYGAKMYAVVNKRGDNQFINIEGEVISDRYAAEGEKLFLGLTNLMLSTIFEPLVENYAFAEDVVAREKKNAADKLNGLVNDKTRYANNRCVEEMFGNDAYSVSEWGTISGIDKITPELLFAHYDKIITSSPINIFVSGEADINEVSAAIQKKITGMKFRASKLAEVRIIKKDSEKTDLCEKTDLTQGKLAMGFRTNVAPADDDFWALVVANNIFGGGMGSKLFNNVREKLSLAYYVHTVIDRPKGFMLLYAGIAFDKLKSAEDEIFSQFDEMIKGNISEAELANAKSEIENGINSCYDDQAQMQSFYMGNIISGVNVSPEEYKEKIRRVTIGEVTEVFKKIQPDTVYFLKGEE